MWGGIHYSRLSFICSPEFVLWVSPDLGTVLINHSTANISSSVDLDMPSVPHIVNQKEPHYTIVRCTRVGTKQSTICHSLVKFVEGCTRTVGPNDPLSQM